MKYLLSLTMLGLVLYAGAMTASSGARGHDGLSYNDPSYTSTSMFRECQNGVKNLLYRSVLVRHPIVDDIATLQCGCAMQMAERSAISLGVRDEELITLLQYMTTANVASVDPKPEQMLRAGQIIGLIGEEEGGALIQKFSLAGTTGRSEVCISDEKELGIQLRQIMSEVRT